MEAIMKKAVTDQQMTLEEIYLLIDEIEKSEQEAIVYWQERKNQKIAEQLAIKTELKAHVEYLKKVLWNVFSSLLSFALGIFMALGSLYFIYCKGMQEFPSVSGADRLMTSGLQSLLLVIVLVLFAPHVKNWLVLLWYKVRGYEIEWID